jgi:enamine deaminase RidA (YjgF/YER057c/UK114 family)
VYEVKSFHVPPDEHAKDAMIKNSKKWMPDHCPIWTCVRVTRLQEVAINVEIEVWAYDPKGAKGGA